MRVAVAAMMRRALFASALVLAACGGTTAPGITDTNHADGGTPPDGGQPIEAGTGSIEGSFDLAFTNAALGSSSPFGGSDIPSIGAKARVDIRKSGAGYEAAVTPRWRSASAFTVKVDARTVTLDGETKIDGSGGATDTWSRIELARSPAGGLSGTFVATGAEDIFQRDVGWHGDLSGSGTIAIDRTPPETRNAGGASGPPGALLPWDTIRVTLAEPIVLSSTPLQLSTNGQIVPVTWSIDAPNPAWVGSSGVSGFVGTWELAKATLAASPVQDRVGLTSTATTTPLSFVTVPHHTGAHGFDDGTVSVATWGQAVKFYGGKSGSDPRCESGGCAAIGPWSFYTCGQPVIGFAGRIESATVATTISVRYRVLLKSQYTQGGVGLYGWPVLIDAASPNVPFQTTSLQVSQTDVQPLASPIDGMTHATAWTTISAQAPAPSTTLGFTIRAASFGCGGGPMPPPVDVELLVDSVTAK